jgi:hypothetical protein
MTPQPLEGELRIRDNVKNHVFNAQSFLTYFRSLKGRKSIHKNKNRVRAEISESRVKRLAEAIFLAKVLFPCNLRSSVSKSHFLVIRHYHYISPSLFAFFCSFHFSSFSLSPLPLFLSPLTLINQSLPLSLSPLSLPPSLSRAHHEA